MYEPSEECIIDFWSKGILKSLPVSSSNPTFIKAASQLRDSCSDNKLCGKSMREDYVRLFSREEMPLAPAYESLYKKTGTSVSILNNISVTEFYTSYGWKSKFRSGIKDDHLGVELLFLTLLVEKYLVLDDEACRSEMRNEIHRYIDMHLLSWVPDWHQAMQKHSGTLCYKGISTLIYACIEDIYSLTGNKTLSARNSEYLKN